MIDPITGTWLDNITCPRCRARHPNVWSCDQAKAVADVYRLEREAFKRENGGDVEAVGSDVSVRFTD